VEPSVPIFIFGGVTPLAWHDSLKYNKTTSEGQGEMNHLLNFLLDADFFSLYIFSSKIESEPSYYFHISWCHATGVA
jgi:hypothetical protein